MASHYVPLLTLLVTTHSVVCCGAVIEESVSVAVEVPTSRGTLFTHLPVLVVRPDDARAHPLALLLHGRGRDATENLRLGRADFPANARYLAQRGYAVLIPTRIGYGIAGGPDVENTGLCPHKSLEPALRTAVSEMTAVLSAAQRQPWGNAGQSVAIGESFGGLIALALAAAPPSGLRAVINFSGGDGGDALHHVDHPCDPEAVTTALTGLGHRARVPALVLYSLNDRYWGPFWPQRWFYAWQAAGGSGRYVALPADKNNGHFIFNRNAAAWHAPVETFLTEQGLP
jgi:dienelactone hydrolase